MNPLMNPIDAEAHFPGFCPLDRRDGVDTILRRMPEFWQFLSCCDFAVFVQGRRSLLVASSAVTQELRRQFPKQPTWIRFANTRKCALWRAKRTLNSSSARIAARFLTRTSFATWRLKKSQMMRTRTAEEDSPSKGPRFAHSWLRDVSAIR